MLPQTAKTLHPFYDFNGKSNEIAIGDYFGSFPTIGGEIFDEKGRVYAIRDRLTLISTSKPFKNAYQQDYDTPIQIIKEIIVIKDLVQQNYEKLEGYNNYDAKWHIPKLVTNILHYCTELLATLEQVLVLDEVKQLKEWVRSQESGTGQIVSPKVFISSTHSNKDGVVNWAIDLAIKLKADNIEVQFDLWSHEVDKYSPSSVKDVMQGASKLLVICTEEYKWRSEMNANKNWFGVGDEFIKITEMLLTDVPQSTLIPVLKSGSPETSIPSWLTGRVYIDFREKSLLEDSYNQLRNTLLMVDEKAPELEKNE